MVSHPHILPNYLCNRTCNSLQQKRAGAPIVRSPGPMDDYLALCGLRAACRLWYSHPPAIGVQPRRLPVNVAVEI